MLLMVGTLIWSAFWIYYGAKAVAFNYVLAIQYFVPAFVAIALVGNFYFATKIYYDNEYFVFTVVEMGHSKNT